MEGISYSNTICPYCHSNSVKWAEGDKLELECLECHRTFAATVVKLPRKKRHYPVITLCGSTRFRDMFMYIQKELTLAGYIVISVGCFGHYEDEKEAARITESKEMLDDMHKYKIDMADAIYVINPGGYIGSSTASEIKYAREHNKEVYYLIPERFKKENENGTYIN